jgi:hypothetical protein
MTDELVPVPLGDLLQLRELLERLVDGALAAPPAPAEVTADPAAEKFARYRAGVHAREGVTVTDQEEDEA